MVNKIEHLFLWNSQTVGEMKSEQIIAPKKCVCTNSVSRCAENWTLAGGDIWIVGGGVQESSYGAETCKLSPTRCEALGKSGWKVLSPARD